MVMTMTATRIKIPPAISVLFLLPLFPSLNVVLLEERQMLIENIWGSSRYNIKLVYTLKY